MFSTPRSTSEISAACSPSSLLGQHQCLSHEHLGIIEGLLCYLRLHHHALSGVLFEYPDYLEMECSTDPHCIGVNQFLADECSTSTAKLGYYRGNGGISHLYLRDQVSGLLLSEELDRLVFLQTSRCLMQIVQAVAAFRVFTDGDGVKVEKKAPRINYVGFIAPLMTLVSSWIHA